MLKKYKNAFINIIKNSGLDPNLFISIEDNKDGDLPVFAIKYKKAPLVFKIYESISSPNGFIDCVYTIYTGSFHLTKAGYVGDASLKDAFTEFEEWLNRVVKVYINDLLEPDLWEQIDQGKSLISGETLSSEETTPFSEEEKLQLKMSINEFRILVKETFQPSEEKSKVIDERLEYLSNALERQFNRIDWRSLALSTILSISATLSLEPEKVNILFGLFRQVFVKVIHLLT